MSYNQEQEAQKWWKANPNSWHSLLEQLTDSGWSIRLSLATDQVTHFASGTLKNEKDPESGVTLSVRYGGVPGAIITLAFVIEIIWPEMQADPAALDRPPDFLQDT